MKNAKYIYLGVFLAVTFVSLFIWRQYRESQKAAAAEIERQTVNTERFGSLAPETQKVEPEAKTPVTTATVRNPLAEYQTAPPPESEPPKKPTVTVAPKPEAAPQEARPLAPLVHGFAPYQAPEKAPAPSKIIAPPGCMIPAVLVITVDSSALQTPILAIVTEDIYNAQKQLIIPARTELHSLAAGTARDRISANGQWTAILPPDGRVLIFSGIALDREKNSDGAGWGITDGSAGLKGRLMQTDAYSEWKLLGASLISGFARGFQETEQTVYGTQSKSGSYKNAGLEAVGSAIDRYANRMEQEIDDGRFVRVPAGKEFYVYTTMPLEPEVASVAGLAQRQQPLNSWELANGSSRKKSTVVAQATQENPLDAAERQRQETIKQVTAYLNAK